MKLQKNNDGTLEITAPVMIPGAKDCDYQNGEPPLTQEEIRKFAKDYETYKLVDNEHGLTLNGKTIGFPKNSFLLTEDTTMNTIEGSKTYPTGTWFITSQITDPEAVETAMSGGYTGYSASVFTRSRADEYLAAMKSEPDTPMPCSCKDVSSSGNSLIKDVPDPVVLSVSLVKSPCLHDSKICELSGDIMENQEDVKSLKSKVLSAMGMSEEAEVVALKSEVSELKETIATMQTDFAEALKSMQEEFTKTLTDALTPVTEEPVAEKSEEAEEEVEEEPVDEPTEEVEEEVEEATEEPVAEKGESKAEPIHDNLEAQKSKPVNIYEFMGRNADGTRKH